MSFIFDIEQSLLKPLQYLLPEKIQYAVFTYIYIVPCLAAKQNTFPTSKTEQQL